MEVQVLRDQSIVRTTLKMKISHPQWLGYIYMISICITKALFLRFVRMQSRRVVNVIEPLYVDRDQIMLFVLETQYQV